MGPKLIGDEGLHGHRQTCQGRSSPELRVMLTVIWGSMVVNFGPCRCVTYGAPYALYDWRGMVSARGEGMMVVRTRRREQETLFKRLAILAAAGMSTAPPSRL